MWSSSKVSFSFLTKNYLNFWIFELTYSTEKELRGPVKFVFKSGRKLKSWELLWTQSKELTQSWEASALFSLNQSTATILNAESVHRQVATCYTEIWTLQGIWNFESLKQSQWTLSKGELIECGSSITHFHEKLTGVYSRREVDVIWGLKILKSKWTEMNLPSYVT